MLSKLPSLNLQALEPGFLKKIRISEFLEQTLKSVCCQVCDARTTAPAGMNAPTGGAVQMRLWGGGIGHHDYCAAVRFGATAAPRTRWESDSSV